MENRNLSVRVEVQVEMRTFWWLSAKLKSLHRNRIETKLKYNVTVVLQIEDLRRMYDLFSRVPMTLDELRRSMCEFVKDTGKALVTDQASSRAR